MRICRYNADKLGLIKGDQLIDVTSALELVPKTRWPRSHGDEMITHLQAIVPKIHANRKLGYVQGVKNVVLHSPIANPTKIIAAQGCCKDYRLDGLREADGDLGKKVVAGEAHGIYLKATSSLVGAGGGIKLSHARRQSDCEIGLALIIGEMAKKVAYRNALDFVAGYSIGLNIKLRGVEDRSLRNSLDTYAVLGPWLTTAEEIHNPDNLNIRLKINDKIRHESNTKDLVSDCRKLIELSSNFFTLYPGDIIMIPNPCDNSPLRAKDHLTCEADIIGRMEVRVL